PRSWRRRSLARADAVRPAEGRPRRRPRSRRRRQAAPPPRRSRSARSAAPAGHALLEEGGQLGRLVDLDLLPAPDLRNGRPGLGLLEIGRGGLEPPGDRVEPLAPLALIARDL